MSKPALYPIKFAPIIKSPIWGGKKLGTVLRKPVDGLESSGESWEISGVEGNISRVSEGALKGKDLKELISEYRDSLVGARAYKNFKNNFPLLIKFIDANQDLSIQVHPNDQLAKKRHNSFGKTEMWYVVDAEENATLISGFNKPTNKAEYLAYFNEGKLMDLLNREKVVDDDVYFLPAGRVHTIGKGLLIAEIQQTSDITYRIYDFDRVDSEGKRRELHVEEAVAAIDYNFYSDYKTTYDQSQAYCELARCDYFVTNRIFTDQPHTADYKNTDSFKILMVLSGNGQITTETGEYLYTTGDTYLIPASMSRLIIEPRDKSKILEVYLPS